MFNNPPKFDELFANVAESNKKWFENLVNKVIRQTSESKW